MSFKATEKTIDKLFSDNIFEIPRNQRKYVWNKNNWNELLTDLELSIKSSTFHFIGSIVLKEEQSINNINRYSIIDGQQRIITISSIIISLMLIYAEKHLDNEFKGLKKYLQIIDSKGLLRYTISEDCNLLISSVASDLSENKDIIEMQGIKNYLSRFYTIESNSILEAISVFYNYFTDHFEDVEKYKEQILGIEYVEIIASTDEDSYTIFEILNARGMELDDHELIKNFIMRYIQPSSKRDDAKLEWINIENILGKNISLFFPHYVLHRYGEKADKRNNRAYKILSKNEKGKNTNDLLNDIQLKSHYYKKIAEPERSSCSATEYKVFNFLRSRKQRQFRPLFLSIMHQKELGKMTDNEYCQYLLFLYNFFVCYNIIGEENSNKLEDVVHKYSMLLENEFNSNTSNQFIKSIKTRIPSIEWFTTAVKKIGYSSSKHTLFTGSQNSSKIKIVLDVLEDYLGNDSNTEYTLEHILPDSSDDESVVQIGNILPLEEELNKRCKNKSVSEKIDIYKKSQFMITQFFANDYDGNFDIESIKKRTEKISKIIFDKILNLNIN